MIMKKLLWGAVALTLLAGCGQALRQSGVVDDTVAVVGGGYRLMNGEAQPMPRAAVREAARRIGVTPDQGARLRQVARQHREALKPADLAARKLSLIHI